MISLQLTLFHFLDIFLVPEGSSQIHTACFLRSFHLLHRLLRQALPRLLQRRQGLAAQQRCRGAARGAAAGAWERESLGNSHPFKQCKGRKIWFLEFYRTGLSIKKFNWLKMTIYLFKVVTKFDPVKRLFWKSSKLSWSGFPSNVPLHQFCNLTCKQICFTYICVCVCVYVYVNMYLYMCMYMYLHMHTFMYVYIYNYVYAFVIVKYIYIIYIQYIQNT